MSPPLVRLGRAAAESSAAQIAAVTSSSIVGKLCDPLKRFVFFPAAILAQVEAPKQGNKRHINQMRENFRYRNSWVGPMAVQQARMPVARFEIGRASCRGRT